MSETGSKEDVFSVCSISAIRKEIDKARANDLSNFLQCMENSGDASKCEEKMCLKTTQTWRFVFFFFIFKPYNTKIIS